jgi:dTDP-4-amino-4,6-dideoxygalactose transaminase
MTASNTAVPMVDLRLQYNRIESEIRDAIDRVIRSQQFVLGPEVEALETEFAAYCTSRFAVGCASGSDALLLALHALGIQPGDEVICPTYTFFATAGSIWRLGARPVFADVDPTTLNLSLETLEAAAERCTKLRAIIAVHLFGRAIDLDGLQELARRHQVPIVEDAAQAVGARDASDRRVGSIGAVGCFSFFPSKNLGGYGDGGMVTTNDAELAARIRLLRVHGETSRYRHVAVGMNSRLDAIQAAVLRAKLPHLDAWTARRQALAERYTLEFDGLGAGVGSGGFEELELPLRVPPIPAPPAAHVFNQFVIRVPSATRDSLRSFLQQRGIATQIYYPVPLHRQDCFLVGDDPPLRLPHSDTAAATTLALPVFAEMTDAQLDHVVSGLNAFLRRPAPARSLRAASLPSTTGTADSPP